MHQTIIFQNGVDALSKIDDAFLTKGRKIYLDQIGAFRERPFECEACSPCPESLQYKIWKFQNSLKARHALINTLGNAKIISQ